MIALDVGDAEVFGFLELGFVFDTLEDEGDVDFFGGSG